MLYLNAVAWLDFYALAWLDFYALFKCSSLVAVYSPLETISFSIFKLSMLYRKSHKVKASWCIFDVEV